MHLALPVLVVGALCHCSWEEAREIARHASVTAQHRLMLPTPIGNSGHEGDCESGCICRGATLVDGVYIADFQQVEVHVLPVDAGLIVWCADLAEDRPAVGLDELAIGVPPISGRQLRARYASLVI
jgi:hypothetical protein